jgi:hypothetical protein
MGAAIGQALPLAVVAAPMAIYFALGARSQRMLAGLRDWMAQHNMVIMAVLCLVIGGEADRRCDQRFQHVTDRPAETSDPAGLVTADTGYITLGH